jgi:hypothetical protein
MKDKRLRIILLLGLIIRVIFILAGAKLYFGRENIFVDGDTGAWAAAIENLIKHGVYTVNSLSEWGYFGRMPGYSFFIGIFYLVTGMNWNAAYPIIGWFQLVMDVFAIYLVFLISIKVLNKNVALIAALLYACYPFIIVWNPVVYSEFVSVFFMLAGLYFFVYNDKKYFYGLSGIMFGIAALMRPQILLMIPVLALIIFITEKKLTKKVFKNALVFLIPFTIIFGAWPARNYIAYKKIVLTQDLRGFSCWNVDVIAFLQYIYSVKAEWEPQFSEIIQNKKVDFPSNAYTSKEDSLNLEKAIMMSKNCGSGFSNWIGYWQKPINEDSSCNAQIAALFNKLRKRQIEEHPVNFYIKLPLQNLKKAIFKSSLVKKNGSTMVAILSSVLFYYRSFLILIGILGSILLIRKKNYFSFFILASSILIYLFLCFGTSPQMRNIEMRYFLQADVLLLFSAAYFLSYIFQKMNIFRIKTPKLKNM